VSKTNLLKTPKFKIGGYARSRHWGTRIYKVIDNYKDLKVVSASKVQEVEVTELVKIGETNKGNFKFTNSKPFKIYNYGVSDRWSSSWGYYPAEATPFTFEK
jgi:hypothetical protein